MKRTAAQAADDRGVPLLAFFNYIRETGKLQHHPQKSVDVTCMPQRETAIAWGCGSDEAGLQLFVAAV
ncbi:hypothetical protein ACM1RC_26065 [Paenibacillus azoreducens]|uniref:hypothetical protein n=1 Tax=Paenibacillus azoreducens TaxID=116718 RepID=UPI0039F49189